MFVDATSLPDGEPIDTDICIVGAGAAGITMARELAGSRYSVALLESGGLELDARTQSLYEGKNTGIPTFDLQVNRLRFFGGTTNHWAGHCRLLDPIDFERRDWVPHSGWPISHHELGPYYTRAQPICGLGPARYEDLNYFTECTGLPALPLDGNRLKTAVYNQSPPTRFGKEYRNELRRAHNVIVYLKANVLELVTNPEASFVSRAEVACIDGPRFQVKAKLFVLATGGMENARLLLLSNRPSTFGLGNDHGLVGRFFMDHVLLRPGADISFSTDKANLNLYDSLHKIDGKRMFAVLAATRNLMERERIGNFRIHLVNRKPRFRDHAGRVFSRLDQARSRDTRNSDFHNSQKSVALHLVAEPLPNPDSRLTLSEDRDLFGQQKLSANWDLAGQDLTTARRALELAAIEFGRMGLGRAYGEIFKAVKLQWPDNLEAGRHHCGTTRMSDSPATGVVDRNCKVHGLANLYIAGSSVFPTIGYANPTLTIVALALRLSGHLEWQLT